MLLVDYKYRICSKKNPHENIFNNCYEDLKVFESQLNYNIEVYGIPLFFLLFSKEF